MGCLFAEGKTEYNGLVFEVFCLWVLGILLMALGLNTFESIFLV